MGWLHISGKAVQVVPKLLRPPAIPPEALLPLRVGWGRRRESTARGTESLLVALALEGHLSLSLMLLWWKLTPVVTYNYKRGW